MVQGELLPPDDTSSLGEGVGHVAAGGEIASRCIAFNPHRVFRSFHLDFSLSIVQHHLPGPRWSRIPWRSRAGGYGEGMSRYLAWLR